MALPTRPTLQYRWQPREDGNKTVLVYYGLRNPPRHTRSILEVAPEIAEGIASLDGGRTLADLPESLTGHPDFARLAEEGVIVDATNVRKPATPEHRQRCIRCVNDDYLIPGLEFDENGLCAFCQCYERAEKAGASAGPQNYITEAELLAAARNNTQSRFDVMVLCTGGKDSTYLLWLLAKKLGLRVLAAAWNMPYTNDTCRENLRRSIELLPSVELIERTLPRDMIRQAMREQFAAIGIPCLCPTVAHVLFFPVAVEERIPFIMQGVEEVQLAVFSYVMSELKSPRTAAKAPAPTQREMTLNFFDMVANAPEPCSPHAITAEFLRYQRSVRQRLAPLYRQLDRTLDAARRDTTLAVPELRRLKTNETYGTWKEVGELIKKEMAWEMPPGHKGMLHTSCRIETVKDHCQFMRFKNMRSTFFPQSVVEVGAGVYFGLISREEGLAELNHLGYNGEPDSLAPLLDDLGLRGETPEGHGEMCFSLFDCRDCAGQG
ncbi:hypothetical protein DND132_3131 [Pseudodesulfovibrio mercurii]|uniref:Uncharacterized protein n=1 Tax=Pseudodesulfovibrio mercurii TaxID=641491 RepID=F0JK85_9BACT|nr:hypothetical protein [Pseudodesulfovibrio mercurii]EGB16334.1 hypothetical protein DND132_3131 [Pseudodesulfovibrio mercurii]